MVESESSVRVKLPPAKRSSMPKRSKQEDYDLRDEYDLSQMTIVPKGRFAPGKRVGKNVIVLAPELASAFPTDEAVNDALRLVIAISKIPAQVPSS